MQSDNLNNENNQVISEYLLKKYKLWLWDWDDTLIDTTTYYVKSMEPEDIKNRTHADLDIEVPNWRFFHALIPYLVRNGVRVGMVSFGTYKIIRAYMDLIFGFNQKYFTQNNIIALCRDGTGRPTEYYPNKNEFTERLMNYYRIIDYDKVVLFDDRMTNISDAIELGIEGVKVIGKDDNLLTEYVKSGRGKEYYVDTLFSKKTLNKLEQKLKTQEQKEHYINTLNNNKKFNKNNKNLLNHPIKRFNAVEEFGFLGHRRSGLKVKDNNQACREQEVIQNLVQEVIPPPDVEVMFNKNRHSNKYNNNKRFIRPELAYIHKNRNCGIVSGGRVRREIEGFQSLYDDDVNNSSSKNNEKSKNKDTNTIKEIVYGTDLQQHKKMFLIMFTGSLLLCLLYLRRSSR